MTKTSVFEESVAMGFQVYNGLLLNLPFKDAKTAANLLPLFTDYCKEHLEKGVSPVKLIETFFKERVEREKFTDIKDDLFSMMRLVERQIVLFDALEDAAFSKNHDMNGPGSLKDILNQVEREDDISDLKEFLKEYQVRVVLTAHPTQFYTDQVLGILNKLSDKLKEKDINEIRSRLLQLGKTRFKKKEKPTPLDEAESLIGILEDVMYHVLPDIHSRLIKEAYKDSEDGLKLNGIINLGFWPGGDRDGNPFVNAKTTLQVAKMLNRSIINKYLDEINNLRCRLTFDGVTDLIDIIKNKLLFLTEYSKEQLIKDLLHLRRVVKDDHMAVFIEHIDDFIFKVQTFGFQFASLDIRQDSSIHKSLFSTIFKTLVASSDDKSLSTITDFNNLSEEKKIELLTRLNVEISKYNHSKRGLLVDSFLDLLTDPIERDVIRSIQVINNIQKISGELGAHRYIISNTQSVSDILIIWIINNIISNKIHSCSVDIVPLFETIEDLHQAPTIMEKLYFINEYSQHLLSRGKSQNIMLGFSDGTKDGGYVAANWEIYKAKKNLTKVSRNSNVRVQFFDGRGGPPARGGGNTHKFYRSLGSAIDSSSIQLTLQGQTINSTYGTIESATYNLEQLVSAGVENNILYKNDSEDIVGENILHELSVLSRDYYTELKNHKSFVPYLENITPLKYYGKSNIGSRPSKRSNSGPLTLTSLRAIPFVGSWSQMKQNIPGYYGFGFALESLIESGRGDELKWLFKNSLFFSTLVENSMQSLIKSCFPLTSYIKNSKEYSCFWNLLKDEYERTKRSILFISGQKELLANDNINRESIKLREKLTLPLMVIQQYALTKVKTESQESVKVLEKLILKSIAASINASRNSV